MTDNRKPCSFCQGRSKKSSDWVVYCRCGSKNTRLVACGDCIEPHFERRNNFSFTNPLSSCSDCETETHG